MEDITQHKGFFKLAFAKRIHSLSFIHIKIKINISFKIYVYMYTSRKLTDAETRIINRSIKRPSSFQ